MSRRGNVLQAEVEGSQPAPYSVRLVFDAAGIADARCDCPYDWGGWCKHIVATLLACIHQPNSVEERPAIEDLLSALDRERLLHLLLRLVERDPALADALESQLTLLQAEQAAVPDLPAPSHARRTSLDTSAIRCEVRSILHRLDRMRSSEAYWQVGSVVGEVRGVLDRAWAFITANDGNNALTILEAISEEYLAGWEGLDDSNGDVGDFFEVLGEAWAEALLTAELTSAERDDWAAKLEHWAEELEDYGIDDAFHTAEAAAVQGWDDPLVRQGLAGKVADRERWAEETAEWPDDLAVARLNVLERQGRHEEFLRLAKLEGQTGRCATMLARLGRVGDAVEYGLEQLSATEDALALATALREAGELPAALRIAEHGLSLDGRKGSLAVWLRDTGSSIGDIELALRAAVVAFREDPDLTSYLRVQELARNAWPEYRVRLLDDLRQTKSYYPGGKVDVFLHEGLVDDAIAAVDGGATHEVVEQVVQAAIQSRPDWVIETCRGHAAYIIDGGKAQYYDSAARWLAKAREAYRIAGREHEWQMLLEELIAEHRRKYKLLPMLEALKG